MGVGIEEGCRVEVQGDVWSRQGVSDVGGLPSPFHRSLPLKSSGSDQLIGGVISYLRCCRDSVAFASVFKNQNEVSG